ncbi:DNA ligase D [Virgibacillus flavescens]|uniref:DNA ligase D n=1 Tax=Virgibacillus flavescens TaxID=1611422 RepID=UPI003D3312E1
MKLMQPVSGTHLPTGDEWLYEGKYDGFRCVLDWEKDNVRLVSRNKVDLTANFPEIIEFCLSNQSKINKLLPVKLDGELAIVNNPYQGNFIALQKRGRLNKKDTIHEAAEKRPASFLAFDMLHERGKSLKEKTLTVRKEILVDFVNLLDVDSTITRLNRLSIITSTTNAEDIGKTIINYKGEGVIAKRIGSYYRSGKQHFDWVKVKNWRKLQGIITSYDSGNDYFTISIYNDKQALVEIGKCKHGVDSNELNTVKQLFVSKGVKKGSNYSLPPAICAEVNSLDLINGELREPLFNQFLPNIPSKDCTVHKLKLDMAMIPIEIEPSNTNKLFWPNKGITKGDLLVYLREVAPYMLPFLHEKVLTIIRSPDGVEKEFFYQKHLPDYAPVFIKSYPSEDEKLFICNKLESLLWFANHGAIEFHTPFQTINEPNPSEIVFDLDPPDRSRFHLAVHAANILKQLLDNLHLVSFVKTSGNKGIQVHIPIPKDSLTYEETGVFTEAIAVTIEKEYPKQFTTERLKKNRQDRLYIDYVQHAKGKTIITAYSPRKTKDATVATPLYWEEVNENLKPELFMVSNVVERIHLIGCPFVGYAEAGASQDMGKVFKLLGKN